VKYLDVLMWCVIVYIVSFVSVVSYSACGVLLSKQSDIFNYLTIFILGLITVLNTVIILEIIYFILINIFKKNILLFKK